MLSLGLRRRLRSSSSESTPRERFFLEARLAFSSTASEISSCVRISLSPSASPSPMPWPWLSPSRCSSPAS
eukprot:scaffold613_cov243-Pinguiococcus_pyrenoidosus.AAC.17